MKRLSYEEWQDLEHDPCEFWDADDTAEYIYNWDLSEAVSEHVDNLHPDIIKPGYELEVFGWSRRRARLHELGDPLEYMLEQIGEENGDPDGDYSPSDAMLRAQARFKGEILRLWHEEGKQRAAELTHVVTVDLYEYCVKHIPEALWES